MSTFQILERSIRTSVERARQGWAQSSPVVQATTLLLVFLIAGGIVLRIQEVGFPPYFTFDEELFVPSAHRYLLGLKDTNDHPPLFKLFMSVGLLLFGYNSYGWRFPALCFGLQSILLAYWLAKRLFGDPRAGLVAAAFVSADGFFLSYSRVGLMDGILTSLILWCMVAAVSARTWRGVVVTALLVGVATSVKWSGVLVSVPAVVAMLVVGRVPWWSLSAFALVPCVHAAVWMAALGLTGEPNDLASIGKTVVDLVRHHVDLGKGTNPLASIWYSWLIFYRPVVIKYTSHGLTKRYASSVGNPALWVAFDACVCALPVFAATLVVRARGALRARFAAARATLLGSPLAKPALLMLLGWAIMIAPWTRLRTQYSFLHYYLPSYAFAVVLLSGLVAALERRRPRVVLVYVAVVAVVAIYFAPVWAEFPISEAAAFRRLVPVPWRP